MEKEKPANEKDPGKSAPAKSSLHVKKERTNSGKSNLADLDASEKKLGRKVSVASSKVEVGSAKARKTSNFARGSKYWLMLLL